VGTADELIDRIINSSRIPGQWRRRDIQRELRSHIEEFVVAAREAGRDQDEIERLVLANFGDPGQIARGFAWVYRHERRRLRALALALSTVLIASCLAAAVLATQAGLAFGFGTPITEVLASRHTVIEALDILASVVAYLGVTSLENLFERHRFQMAALVLAAILTLLVVSCAAVGLHITFPLFGLVNGVFFRAVQLFVSARLARVGIVVVCFSLAGLVSALLWSPPSSVAIAATCTSWLVLGAGYQLMTHLAPRVDAAVLNGLERIHGALKGEIT
jgi:hypothetical protein